MTTEAAFELAALIADRRASELLALTNGMGSFVDSILENQAATAREIAAEIRAASIGVQE